MFRELRRKKQLLTAEAAAAVLTRGTSGVLALAGDAMAADHYAKLDKKASDCTGCGHCDRRCPFHVAQSGRMKEISRYFEIQKG